MGKKEVRDGFSCQTLGHVFLLQTIVLPLARHLQKSPNQNPNYRSILILLAISKVTPNYDIDRCIVGGFLGIHHFPKKVVCIITYIDTAPFY
jgi:hypothetical protein